MDKKELQGRLMNEHRIILNKISDIKANNFELTQENKKEIAELERKLKIVAQKLYTLYQ
jgi:hypothetical protein